MQSFVFRFPVLAFVTIHPPSRFPHFLPFFSQPFYFVCGVFIRHGLCFTLHSIPDYATPTLTLFATSPYSTFFSDLSSVRPSVHSSFYLPVCPTVYPAVFTLSTRFWISHNHFFLFPLIAFPATFSFSPPRSISCVSISFLTCLFLSFYLTHSDDCACVVFFRLLGGGPIKTTK